MLQIVETFWPMPLKLSEDMIEAHAETTVEAMKQVLLTAADARDDQGSCFIAALSSSISSGPLARNVATLTGNEAGEFTKGRLGKDTSIDVAIKKLFHPSSHAFVSSVFQNHLWVEQGSRLSTARIETFAQIVVLLDSKLGTSLDGSVDIEVDRDSFEEALRAQGGIVVSEGSFLSRFHLEKIYSTLLLISAASKTSMLNFRSSGPETCLWLSRLVLFLRSIDGNIPYAHDGSDNGDGANLTRR